VFFIFKINYKKIKKYDAMDKDIVIVDADSWCNGRMRQQLDEAIDMCFLVQSQRVRSPESRGLSGGDRYHGLRCVKINFNVDVGGMNVYPKDTYDRSNELMSSVHSPCGVLDLDRDLCLGEVSLSLLLVARLSLSLLFFPLSL
jgi:hypothetical protein